MRSAELGGADVPAGAPSVGSAQLRFMDQAWPWARDRPHWAVGPGSVNCPHLMPQSYIGLSALTVSWSFLFPGYSHCPFKAGYGQGSIPDLSPDTYSFLAPSSIKVTHPPLGCSILMASASSSQISSLSLTLAYGSCLWLILQS